MHDVGFDVVEQALIMGDDEERAVLAAQRVDAVGDDAQRVDVEAEIGLVEHAKLGREQRHLQDFEPLLLAAGEADVDRPLQHLEVDLEALRRRAHGADEIGRREVGLAARAALGVERGLEEGHRRRRRGSRPDTGTPGTRPWRRARSAPAPAGSRRSSRTSPPVTS